MLLTTDEQEQDLKPKLGEEELQSLIRQYQKTRDQSIKLSTGLSEADLSLQSMPDASPIKWHLAHTTWFFETFILKSATPSYKPFNEVYSYLFNSYYNGVGKQFPRAQRGLQSRPHIEEIFDYRRHVDSQLLTLMESFGTDLSSTQRFLIELGIHHEQQHQELTVTDFKHALFCNPINLQKRERFFPGIQPLHYEDAYQDQSVAMPEVHFTRVDEGIYKIGYDGQSFHYDNEGATHNVYLEQFDIANTPVSNGEYMEFIEDGGYQNPELWLSEAWMDISKNEIAQPLYWQRDSDQYHEFTLGGMRPIHNHSPLCHISYYEADAFARWRGMRLPTEMEWEVAAKQVHAFIPDGNFLESGHLHPRAPAKDNTCNFFGNVWEWTQSAYSAYPGFKPFAGIAGEYNGKFMCNQFVLRGGSCASPKSHIRHSYRNFFYPHQNWQFSGLRLVRNS